MASFFHADTYNVTPCSNLLHNDSLANRWRIVLQFALPPFTECDAAPAVQWSWVQGYEMWDSTHLRTFLHARCAAVLYKTTYGDSHAPVMEWCRSPTKLRLFSFFTQSPRAMSAKQNGRKTICTHQINILCKQPSSKKLSSGSSRTWIPSFSNTIPLPGMLKPDLWELYAHRLAHTMTEKTASQLIPGQCLPQSQSTKLCCPGWWKLTTVAPTWYHNPRMSRSSLLRLWAHLRAAREIPCAAGQNPCLQGCQSARMSLVHRLGWTMKGPVFHCWWRQWRERGPAVCCH